MLDGAFATLEASSGVLVVPSGLLEAPASMLEMASERAKPAKNAAFGHDAVRRSEVGFAENSPAIYGWEHRTIEFSKSR